MTELDQVIAAAYASEGKQEDVNKVYVTLLRSLLYVPIKKGINPEDPDTIKPLFVNIEEKYFMPVFDTVERLKAWAGDQFAHMEHIELSGSEVVAGINDEVYLCLNLATENYKEFSPMEVKYLKNVVARIRQLKEK